MVAKPIARPLPPPIFDADPITPGIQNNPGVVTPVGPPRVVTGPRGGPVGPAFGGGFQPVNPYGGLGGPVGPVGGFGGPGFVPTGTRVVGRPF